MNTRIALKCVLLATTLSGCAASPGSDPGPEPVIVNETGSGLSIAASADAFAQSGVAHWEIEALKPIVRVRGYDAEQQLISDMSFEQNPDNTASVREALTGETLSIGGASAGTAKRLSVKTERVFAALSRDATALHSVQVPEARPAVGTKSLEGWPCTECVGVLLMCGEYGSNLDYPHLHECNADSVCGVCFGFW